MSDERAAFAGQITDLPVVELLRTIFTGEKTGVARFETNLGTATVWFRDGNLVDADMGRFHMGDAVRRLMSTDAGSFEVEFKPVTRRRLITETTSDLLEQGAQASHVAQGINRPRLTLPASAEPAKRGPRARTRPAAGWKPTAGGSGRDGGGGAASPDMLRRLEALRRAADRQQPRAEVLSSTSALGHITPNDSTRSTGETPQAGLEALNRLAQRAATAQQADTDAPTPEPADTPDDLERTVSVPQPEIPPSATVAPKGRAAINTVAVPTLTVDAPPKAEVIDTARPPSPPIATPGRKAPGPRATEDIQRRPRSTVSGIPAALDVPKAEPPKASPNPADDNGWSFVDPSLAKEADDDDDDDADKTLMRSGPVAIAKPPTKRPGGNRKTIPRALPAPEDRAGHPTRVDPAEDLSDPLPIGTSWSAPAHISTPRSKPIESDQSPSAGGEIGKGSRVSAKTLVAFKPELPRDLGPDPGATMTDGFRPITEAEVSGKVPRVPGPSLERASAVAEKLGLAYDRIEARDEPRPASGATQVGRYEVLLRIARGGMGTVYLCQVTGAGGFRRLFALKVIRDHLSRNDEYVRMLLQEARIASRLHHPNVVGIVDIGNLANQHYLVMDYVEGCTLSELLKVHLKTRPPHLIIPIVLDALTGLHAAHTLTDDDGSPLTLVHCDFSPQNMLVGTNGICRITDFGIARASNALPERSSITRGKPAYIAPEQITGRPFDHRADIFAAGVVLWNALTGEQLFKGDTPEEVLDKVLNMQIPAPSGIGLRPPKKLDKVVLRALERDPERRYQSAEEMLIELRKVAIGSDLLAPSSEVAQWVVDTFGTQLELRRQAAGLAPGGLAKKPEPKPVTALALRDDAPGADDSATHALLSQPQDAAAASQTMMLHSGRAPAAAATAATEATRASDAVLGNTARKLIMAMVISAVAGLLAVAVVRPELLTGGMLDEEGEFIDLSAPSEDPNFEAELGKPPEGKTPETKAPETKAATPETKAPEPAVPEVEAPVAQDPDPLDEPLPELPPEPEIELPPAPKPKPEPEPEPKPRPKKPADDEPPAPKPAPKPEKPEPEPEPAKPEPAKPEPEAPELPSAPSFDAFE